MTLKKQILSYSSVNIINAAVPFLLLPILTNYLLPSEYGILSLFQLLMAICLPLLLMNTNSLIIVEYSKFSEKEFRQLITSILLITFASFFLIELLFFILQNSIKEFFKIEDTYIFLLPLFVLFQAIPTIVPIIYQAKKEPLKFGKYKISMTIINIALSLIFITILDMKWEGRILGISLSFLIFTIIGIFILYKNNLIESKININSIKNSLNFGLPLVPHSIAGIFLSMSDRIFIANMLDVSSVGIYAIAFQISSAISIIMLSINQAWAPNLNEKLNSNPTFAEKVKIVKQTYKIAIIMIIITIIFILFSPLIYNLFINEKFYAGVSITIFLSIAFLFKGFYFLVTNYIFFLKKTKYLSMITILSSIIISVLNYFLIPKFGIMGSSIATLICWILQFLIVFYLANKLYKMPWSLKNEKIN
jgi:O-antigen/teichoic acid export membrane protein